VVTNCQHLHLAFPSPVDVWAPTASLSVGSSCRTEPPHVMKHNFSEAYSRPDSQEFPRLLCDPKVICRVHKTQPLVFFILSQSSPVCTLILCSLRRLLILSSHLCPSISCRKPLFVHVFLPKLHTHLWSVSRILHASPIAFSGFYRRSDVFLLSRAEKQPRREANHWPRLVWKFRMHGTHIHVSVLCLITHRDTCICVSA
jgi:hypothetical protein